MDMRQGPHKNRSRSRSRRPISQSGRVYESNGPDVKVRGTAQTVADKYLQLARDAHSAGDTVMAEGYFQHAEHYLRIVAASQPYGQQNGPQRRPGDDYAYDDGDEGEDEQPTPVASPSGGGGNGEAHRLPQPQPQAQQQPTAAPLSSHRESGGQPVAQPVDQPDEQPIEQPTEQPWGGPEPEFLRRGSSNGSSRSRRSRQSRSGNGGNEAPAGSGDGNAGSAGDEGSSGPAVSGHDNTEQA